MATKDSTIATPTAATVTPPMEAKKLFCDLFTERATSSPLQTILSKTLSMMGLRRSMTITEGDVREAARQAGFSSIPSPLRHNMRDRDVFALRTREILYEFRSDLPIEKEALRILHFLDEVIENDPTTRFSTDQTVDGSKIVKLESPRGIRAQFIQTDWDFFESFAGDSDDETYVDADDFADSTE